MRPIGDALRWHGLNSLRAACSFGDKGSLFVSAMIFSCFLQGKTEVYCPAYYFPMLLRKQREKGSSQVPTAGIEHFYK